MWKKKKALLSDETALRARAVELGVNTSLSPTYNYELQRRVLEAETYLRARRMWLFALISAVASVVSALAAWGAISLKNCAGN